MQNGCGKRVILHKSQTQATVKGPVTITNNHWYCLQSQWTGKTPLLDPLLTTQSLFEQCRQESKGVVFKGIMHFRDMKYLLPNYGFRVSARQHSLMPWSFVFKLMLIKCTNYSGFHLFLPLSMYICLSISFTLNLLQCSMSSQSHKHKKTCWNFIPDFSLLQCY